MEGLWKIFNGERKLWIASTAFENAFKIYLTLENTAPKGEQSAILVLLRAQGSGFICFKLIHILCLTDYWSIQFSERCPYWK